MTKPTGFIGPTTLKLFAGYDKRGLYFSLSFNYLIQFEGSYVLDNITTNIQLQTTYIPTGVEREFFLPQSS